MIPQVPAPVTSPDALDAPGGSDGIAWIPAPRSPEETGVRYQVLEGIALKTIARAREINTRQLAESLSLGPRLVDDLFQRLRKAQLVEVTGLKGSVYSAILTTEGRARADQLFSASQYVGPIPVSLEEYDARMRAQSLTESSVEAGAVREAFARMVLPDEVVRQLGIAIVSGAPVVIAGPSGTGKTSVAGCIPRAFQTGVFIPHAVEVNGEVITVFDPGLHRPLPATPPADHDRRWVYCERPFIVAGGELTTDMLDLRYNPVSGFYTAPPQMKANAGVFVIDDFGRQRARPEELLNRWIVPLDRGIDFLTLHGGSKFAVPFAVLVVFATNLDVGSGFATEDGHRITDTAFLRRIPNKVNLGYATRDQFHEIFRRAAADAGLSYDRALVDWVVEMLSKYVNEPLRPCIPRDLIRHVVWESRYDGSRPELTGGTLSRAMQTYFGLGAVAAPASPAVRAQ